MTDVHAQQEQRARDWFGFRPSRARPCPRTVAGLRCRVYSGVDACSCRRYARLLDHARSWRAKNGDPVVTAEPYWADGEDVAALLADCSDLRLEVSVGGRSLWNPGETVLFIVHRSGTQISGS